MTKTAFVFAAAVVLMVSFSTTAFAACDDGSSSWIAAWTDQFGQTTYSVTAPCRVFTGSTFEITATVSDGSYPMTDVGFAWAIKDTASCSMGAVSTGSRPM